MVNKKQERETSTKPWMIKDPKFLINFGAKCKKVECQQTSIERVFKIYYLITQLYKNDCFKWK